MLLIVKPLLFIVANEAESSLNVISPPSALSSISPPASNTIFASVEVLASVAIVNTPVSSTTEIVVVSPVVGLSKISCFNVKFPPSAKKTHNLNQLYQT